jgi:hypothetical protein
MNTLAVSARPQRLARRFYIGMAALVILLNVFAFSPSFIDPSARNVPLPLTLLVTAHAVTVAAWILLFLTQAALVAMGRTDVHRRVGVVGVVLTAAVPAVGYFAVIENARRGFDLSGDFAVGRVSADPIAFVSALFLLLIFATVAATGLAYRRRPDVHKRLMLLALVGGLVVTPMTHITAHWSALQPWANSLTLAVNILFLSSSALYDRFSLGRIHPASLWGALSIFVAQIVLILGVAQTSTWHEFATWLAG